MSKLIRGALVVITTMAAAAAPAATWIVPGMANTPGLNNTFFASELKIRNLGTSPAAVSFELLPLGGATPPAASRTVAAGETLVLPNALVALFGTGFPAGTLRISTDQPIFLNARTYNNADPSGTFGLAVDAVDEAHLLSAGQTGHVGWVSDSGGFRTNVGVVLAAAGSAADLVVFGASGSELGRRTFSGGPSATQVRVTEFASGDLSTARFELRVTAGKATGYSAVVDNVTGDGFTVQPELVPPGTWTDVVLNGVARGPGRFNTFFRTDARLVNTSSTARKVTISGVSLAAGGQPVTATASLDLPAHATRELIDVLGTPLGAPEGVSGSLRFVADGPVLVLGRTSNIRADGSTFGAVQRTFSASQYLLSPLAGAFVGLLQSSATPGFRTNVGFTAGPAGAVVNLTLKDRAGSVLSARPAAFTLPANGFTQPSLADLFPGVAIPDDVTLEVSPADGTVDAYASFIDNGTGDPVIYALSRTPLVIPQNLQFVSQCAPKPGVAGLINGGTSAFRVDLDPARYPDALCNDGTPGVFYIRKGTGASVNRWLIFLEGGGSCANAADCAKRWCAIDTNFGAFKMSNRYVPEHGIGGGGILQDRPDNALADFNTIWIHYCSSDAWSGRIRDRVLFDVASGQSYSLHFLGARILEAVISELRAGVSYRDATGTVTVPSLDDADVVLLVGESGGGAGVKRNLDRVTEYLNSTNHSGRVVVRGVIDAADHPSNPDYVDYEAQTRGAWLLQVGRNAGVYDESCRALHPNDSWRCGDSAHNNENHITTPFFSRTDLMDENVLGDFGTEGWEFGDQTWFFGKATWEHLDRLTRIRSTAEEKDAINVDPGVYGPHCDNHTALRDSAKFYTDKVARGGSLFSFNETLRNWLLSSEPKVVMEPKPTGDPIPKSAVCTN